MKHKTKFMVGSLLLSMAVLIVPLVGCGIVKKEPNLNASKFVSADENAEFKRDGAVYNNKANRKIRAKQAQELAEQEAADAKKKAEVKEDKGEGQVKVKF